LRLRPILRTSFAFILGVVPLLLGTGAGAEMRRTLGVAVFSGMLGVTLFGIFLTPVFFNVIEWFIDWRLAGSKRAQFIGQVLLFPLHAFRLAVVWPARRLAGVLGRSRGPVERRGQLIETTGVASSNGQGKHGAGATDGKDLLPSDGVDDRVIQVQAGG